MSEIDWYKKACYNIKNHIDYHDVDEYASDEMIELQINVMSRAAERYLNASIYLHHKGREDDVAKTHEKFIYGFKYYTDDEFRRIEDGR
jgi:hypothetical protein